jgi:hypothetical protein
MRGRSIPLPPSRRFICDLMRASMRVPTVPVQRCMHLKKVIQARAALAVRPPWTALFSKAFALVARDMPELRRAYVKFPWPHLYEYPVSRVSIAIERDYLGEKAVFIGLIRDPAAMPLPALARAIRDLRETPIDSSKDFQRLLRLSRMPTPVRRLAWWIGLNLGRQRGNYFGTFGITSYSRLGAESLHPLSPCTATINYGVIAGDGSVPVRISYDHRVLDGSTIARALERVEALLTGEICGELQALSAEPDDQDAPSQERQAPRAATTEGSGQPLLTAYPTIAGPEPAEQEQHTTLPTKAA